MRQGFIYLLTALLICGVITAQGQNTAPPMPAAASGSASIVGTVTKAGTNAAVKNAQVFLRSAGPSNTNAQLQQLLNGRGGQGGQGGQGRGQDLAAVIQNLPPDLLANLPFGGGGNGGFGNVSRGALPGDAVASANVDNTGHFKFAGVRPGEYRIFVEGDGYIRQEYGQRTSTGVGTPIALLNDQSLEVNFQLVQGGVIAGKVIDPHGEPLADITVQAYNHSYSGGKRSLTQAATAQTNDQGEYRLFYLLPGDYFVAVEPPPGTLDIPGAANDANNAGARGFGGRGGRGGGNAGWNGGDDLPPVYYPGVVDSTQASAIRVAAARQVEGVDIHLRPVRLATLNGRVETPFPQASDQSRRAAIDQLRGQAQQAGGQRGQGGQGGQGGGQGRGGNIQDIAGTLQSVLGGSVQVSLDRIGESQNPQSGFQWRGGGDGTRVSQDGTFSIRNVTPGAYNLTATARDQAGQEYSARTKVNVGDSDITGIVMGVQPATELRGQLYADAPPAGFKASSIRVSLVADDSPVAGIAAALAEAFAGVADVANQPGAAGRGGQNTPAQIADDGSFTLKGVGALEYRVRLTGLPKGAYLKAGRIGDTDPLNAPFVVTDPKAILQIQIGFSPGKVNGTIVDAEGKPAANIVAALVPEASQRGRNDLYFSGTSDRTGRVNFANIPPGNYKLFAWEEMPTGAFQYPDFIRGFEERGQPVVVEKGSSADIEVKLIPADKG